MAIYGLTVPSASTLQVGADEGFELVKAALCERGYSPYADIWNDQPPLYTFLLAETLRHTGSSIFVTRSITTLAALVLVGSMSAITRRYQGLSAAGLAVILTLASPGFVELSSSCMLEIPALAPAVAGLAVLAVTRRKRWRMREVLAGALFGTALEVKLIPVYLLGVAAVMVWLEDCGGAGVAGAGLSTYEPQVDSPLHGSHVGTKEIPLTPTPVPSRLRPEASAAQGGEGNQAMPTAGKITVWRGTISRWAGDMFVICASTVAVFVAIDLVIERGAYLAHFGQTWASHFGGAKTTEYGSAAEHPFRWWLLVKNWDMTIPAALDVMVCAGSAWRTWRAGAVPSAAAVVPVAWLCLVLVLFGLHRPWWPYYYVHIALPLCWCAAVGIATAVRWVTGGGFATAGAGSRLTAEARRTRRGTAPKSKILTRPSQNERRGGPKPPIDTNGHELVSIGVRSWSSAGVRSWFSNCARWSRGNARRMVVACMLAIWLLGTAGWMGARVYLEVSGIRNSPQIYNSLVLHEIARFKSFTEWMYTDEPIYSFHADIPMPPDLAVMVLKRFWAGEMTYERLTKDLMDYKPGLILLRNTGREPPFQELLRSDYRIVYEDGEHRLYAHKTISGKPHL